MESLSDLNERIQGSFTPTSVGIFDTEACALALSGN